MSVNGWQANGSIFSYPKLNLLLGQVKLFQLQQKVVEDLQL